MTKEKKELYRLYQPIHNRARFWLHSEACYTEEELNQRAWILKTRANSGIHPDYLSNPSSWFAEDSQALINVYEHSWFYSDAFKTRHILSQDDFHVQPIDSQRLQWPALYDLMQKTGDYLLLRNKKLAQTYLNQPMNFFLLDLNNILKGICQNPNIKQTQEQLEHLTRYVRAVEKNTSPFVGSDRLFLANFRSMIDDEIHPQFTHMIESQLLRDRLGETLKIIKQLSMERNRILHFALNINPVNPHPYTFAIDKPADLKAFPTQAVKECGTSSLESSTVVVANPLTALKLTMEQLKDCPNFELISMQDQILEHYAQAISDLDALDQFQGVVSRTIDLLGQAGEVYTVYQFKEQLSLLLKQIDYFIDESSTHIEEIIHANTHAYHKAIQEEQNSSFLTKLLSYEREKIKTFIHNQDTLAQFPSTTADLAKTSRTLKEHVDHVIVHLNGPRIKNTNFAAIAAQAQELNTLMNSMHHWVKVQYENKGLEPPAKPQKLKLLPQSKSDQQSHFFSRPAPSQSSKKLLFIDNTPKFNFSYVPPRSYLNTVSRPAIEACPRTELVPQHTSQQLTPANNNLLLGLVVSFPIGLFLLYLVYRAYKENNKSEEQVKTPGSEKDYEELKTKVDDLFIEIQKVKNVHNTETESRIEDFTETYSRLNRRAQKSDYDIEELNVLYEEMDYFYNYYYQKSSKLFF